MSLMPNMRCSALSLSALAALLLAALVAPPRPVITGVSFSGAALAMVPGAAGGVASWITKRTSITSLRSALAGRGME